LITYVDSSVLVRSYLPDEREHHQLNRVIRDPQRHVVTGTLTRIEVTGALVRAGRANRTDPAVALGVLEADLARDGAFAELTADPAVVEPLALDIALAYGLRALDAWHLAVAATSLPQLDDGVGRYCFASRDAAQSAVAEELGFELV
jgi:predicted nucleic acid-binding protein